MGEAIRVIALHTGTKLEPIDVKTLQEMINAGDRILFISPDPLYTISIGIGLGASDASLAFSFDGETFDDDVGEFIIKSGEKLELSGVKIAAIKFKEGTTQNSGMITWSY